MCEGRGGLQGDTEVTPRALLLMLTSGRHRGAFDGRHTPRGPKNNKKGLAYQ